MPLFQHQGIERKTEKAVLLTVKTENGNEKVWFPKSKCEFTGSYVECPKWLARKKKLVSTEPEDFASLLEEKDGNEAEAALVREEIEGSELHNVLEAVAKASAETGMSKAEILFRVARAA